MFGTVTFWLKLTCVRIQGDTGRTYNWFVANSIEGLFWSFLVFASSNVYCSICCKGSQSAKKNDIEWPLQNTVKTSTLVENQFYYCHFLNPMSFRWKEIGFSDEARSRSRCLLVCVYQSSFKHALDVLNLRYRFEKPPQSKGQVVITK